jgi:hypothetical protein
MCQDVKTQRADTSQLGTNLEKAMASGNFAEAKQALRNAFAADIANGNKALPVMKSTSR